MQDFLFAEHFELESPVHSIATSRPKERMVQRPLAETRSLDKGYAGALMSDPRICVPAKDLNETKLARPKHKKPRIPGPGYLPARCTCECESRLKSRLEGTLDGLFVGS